MKSKNIFKFLFIVQITLLAFFSKVYGQQDTLKFSVLPSDQFVCQGVDSVHFFADSYSPRARFIWQFSSISNNDWNDVDSNAIMIPYYNTLSVTDTAIVNYKYRCLLVDNFTGADSTFSNSVIAIVISPPDASFTIRHPEDSSIISKFCSQTAIQFQDESIADISNAQDNHIISWEWIHEGTVFSHEQNPMYLFTGKGQKQVALTVWDSFGCSATHVETIDIVNESIQITGPDIVCGNQFTVYEAEMKDWIDSNDLIFIWNLDSHTFFMDTMVLNNGRIIEIHWKETDEPQQINIQVMAYSHSLKCYSGKIIKPVLLTSKKSPDEIIALIRKNPDDSNSGLLIAIVKDIDLFDFRWGYNNTVVSSGENATKYYDFGSFNPENTYWVDIKFKNNEACWTRKVYQAGD